MTKTTKLAANVALFALSSSISFAELPPIIPRAVLFGNPEYISPQISPGGKQIAYLKADTNRVMQIWVSDLACKNKKQLTHERLRGIGWGAVSWAYNGQLLYLKDNDGDEMNHLFVCNPSGGEVRDLTPFPSVQSTIIGREPKKPDELLITLNRRGKSVFDVWSVNLLTAALTPIMQNPGDIVQWIVTPSLEIRGAVAKDSDGNSELRLLTRQKTWEPFYSWKVTDTVEVIGVSEDEKEIYLKSNVGTDTAALYTMELGTGHQRRIFSSPESDVQGFLTHPLHRTVQAAVRYRLKPQWQILDPSITKDFTALEKVSSDSLAGISRDLRDEHWVVVFQSDSNPPTFYLWERKQQKATYLFSSWPELRQYRLAPMKAFELKARDGLSLPSYLALPVGVEPKNLPLVLLVHGGPGDRDWWGYGWMTQWLANRGYAVLEVNYRGSGGFGKSFMNAAYRELAGKMHDDLIDGVNWAIREGIADPKRIAIMGGSYGGYETLVGLTFTPDVFACGVETCGISNLRTFVENAPGYWKPYLPGYWYKLIGNPEIPADRQDMERRSPLFHIESIKAPVLVGQGANDPRVKKMESDQMVAAMRQSRKQVDYIVFPDEGHGFARPENNRRFNAAAEEFLARHLGGRFEPAIETESVDKFRK